MNVTTELTQAYNEALNMNSASLAYLSGSTMVSCSCYLSYSDGTRYEYDANGYKKSYVDLSILVDRSSIIVPIEPLKTEIWINDTKYFVGNLITNNEVFHWITLRAEL